MLAAMATMALLLLARAVATAGNYTVTEYAPDLFQTRVQEDLLMMYTFSQSECKARSFADAVSTNYVGDLAYSSSWAVLTKCPTYTDANDTEFDYAYNGAHFVGERYINASAGLSKDDSIISSSYLSALLHQLDGVTDFTLEFWIVPSFTSGSTTNQYVLFEMGAEMSSSTIGTSYTWACGSSKNYGLQVLYDDSDEIFSIEYRYGSAAASCTTLSFSGSSQPLSAGKLYHLVLKGSYSSSTSIFTASISVQGYDETSPITVSLVSSYSISFTSFFTATTVTSDTTSSYVLRLGSSPLTLSTYTDFLTTYSWPGDMMHFAFYSRSLNSTEIAQNFDAKLRNSAPVAANAEVRHVFYEDTLTSVDFTKAIFDFDDVFGLTSEEMSYRLVAAADGDLLGNQFSIDGGSVFNFSSSVSITNNDLTWMNLEANAWGWDPDTTFGITGTDPNGVTSGTGTISPEVYGTEDTPEELDGLADENTRVAQAAAKLINFTIVDIDCSTRSVEESSSGVNDTFDEMALNKSCTEMGQITSITILAPNLTAPLGRLYLPEDGECPTFNSSRTEITANTTFSAGDSDYWYSYREGKAEVRLCFEACLTYDGSTNECPDGVDGSATAILGNLSYSFYGTDNQGQDGQVGSVTIVVTNVLTISQASYITHEETAVEITLSGTDEFCIRFSDNAACPRTKTYEITGLPDSYQGIVYRDQDGTDPVAVGDIIEGDGSTATLWIIPTTDYFSMDSWPICGPSLRTEDNPTVASYVYSYCVETDDAISTYPCEGPLCNGYTITMPPSFAYSNTTADLTGNAMGGCGASTDDGCPIELYASLVVELLTSEPLAASTVHVFNENDQPTVYFPSANLSGVYVANTTSVSWTNSTGGKEYIQIVDPDGDSRVMDVVIETPSRGKLLFPNATASDLNLRFSLNSANFMQGSTLLGMTGTLSEINEALKDLHYLVETTVSSDTLTFYVLDSTRDIGPASFNSDDLNAASIYDGAYVVTASIDVYFADNTETESFLLATITLWAAIIGGCLLCCMCVYSVLHCIFRRALMGERAAMWVVKNVFFTKITDQKDRDLSPEARRLSRIAMGRITAEEVTLRRVLCCFHLLARICPCCVKFTGDESRMPDRDSMLAATVSDLSFSMARKHVPGEERIIELRAREAIEFERHSIQLETGQIRYYLFNPHTGKSLWEANVRVVDDDSSSSDSSSHNSHSKRRSSRW